MSIGHVNDDLRMVRVSYKVERTVYVHAKSMTEAKRLARDADQWVDADPIAHEHIDQVSIVGGGQLA